MISLLGCWPRTVALLLLLAVSNKGSICFAVSYVPGSYTPTNYVTVRHADAVVIAIPKAPPKSSPRSDAVFEVQRQIAGPAAPRKIEYRDRFGGDLWRYRFGEPTILLLYADSKSALWQAEGLFSPDGRTVTSSAELWEPIVRQYLQIAKQKQMASEIRALRALLKQPSLSQNSLLQADIEQFLGMPHRLKSVAENTAIFRSAKDQNTAERVLWVFGYHQVTAAKPLFDELIGSGQWKDYPGAVTNFFAAIKDRSAFPTLVTQLPIRSDRQQALRGIVALAREQDAPQLGELLIRLSRTPVCPPATDDHHRRAEPFCLEHPAALRPLGRWLTKNPNPQNLSVLREFVGSDYVKHHRDRLTLALATHGDTDVVDWAFEMSKDPYRPIDAPNLPEYVLACSPLEQSKDQMLDVLNTRHEQYATQLRALVNVFEPDSGCPLNWDTLNVLRVHAETVGEFPAELLRLIFDEYKAGSKSAKAFIEKLGGPDFEALLGDPIPTLLARLQLEFLLPAAARSES